MPACSFFGRQPSQSLTPPSLNPCMFVFAGPCLLFPTCSNRLLGGSNQVFIARLQAFFLSLTTGLAVSLDRNLWSTTSRKSSHTKACRGSVTRWIPGQNFNHAIGAMKDVKLKRVHVSRSFDGRLKCSCKRMKCDTDSCMDALLSCLQVILCRFWKKLLCSH